MKELNRIKVVLVEKKRTVKWLAEEFVKIQQPSVNSVSMCPSPTCTH